MQLIILLEVEDPEHYQAGDDDAHEALLHDVQASVIARLQPEAGFLDSGDVLIATKVTASVVRDTTADDLTAGLQDAADVLFSDGSNVKADQTVAMLDVLRDYLTFTDEVAPDAITGDSA